MRGMSVTVGLITRDSVSKVGEPVLRLIVHRVIEEVPVASIIVTDASVDSTVSVITGEASRHGVSVTVLKDDVGNRGYARWLTMREYLRLSHPGFFMFLDDDAVLRRGWWSATVRLLKGGCRVVWGVNWSIDASFLKWVSLLGESPLGYLTGSFRVRGGFHDTLMDRGIVEALVKHPPPIWLHTHEDAYALRVMRAIGVEPCVNTVGVIHLNESGNNPLGAALRGLRGVRALRIINSVVGETESSRLSRVKPHVSLSLLPQFMLLNGVKLLHKLLSIGSP